MLTYNSMDEGLVYKGSSTSKKLFDLVLRIKLMEIRYGMNIHGIHVAGTRMIEQRVDSLLISNMLEGVMLHKNMLSFIPLNLPATTSQLNLGVQIISWWIGNNIDELEPQNWFEREHDIKGYTTNLDGITIQKIKPGVFLWSHSAAVANVALEELIWACHKRQRSVHIFVCPKLMKHLWIGQLYNASDIACEIRAKQPYWDNTQHEPLILDIFSPSFLIAHGRSGIPLPFWTQEGFCAECGDIVKAPKGIFCGNFMH